MAKIKASKEFIAGTLVILAVVGLYWGINFLKGNDLFKKERVFYAVYDNAQGLLKSNPVLINGFQVGQINDLYFHPDMSGRLVAKIVLSNDYPIPSNSEARIVSDGLLGEKQMILVLGDAKTDARIGDTLQSGIETSLSETLNREVAPVKIKAEKLMGSLDTAIQVITGFLDRNTEATFRNSMQSLDNSIDNLESISRQTSGFVTKNRTSFDVLIKNLEKLSTTLALNQDEFSRVMGNVATISDSLGKSHVLETMESLTRAVQHTELILAKMESGESTAGKIFNDDTLYKDIDKALQSLDLLLLDVKAHPKRYVGFSLFGGGDKVKKEKKETKGTEEGPSETKN